MNVGAAPRGRPQEGNHIGLLLQNAVSNQLSAISRKKMILNSNVLSKEQQGHMADKEAERVKYETEVLKLMTLLAVAVGGGALSLALGAITPLRTGLAAGGILVTLVLLVSGWRQHKYVRTLIERL